MMRSSRQVIGAGLLTVALAVGVAAETTQAAPSTDQGSSGLRDRLTTILGDSRLAGSQYALTVRDLDAHTLLYQTNGGNRLLPASNAKLLTSAAALDVLGPDYRFTTSALTTGRRTGHTVRGNLYLHGTGDPTAKAADYDRLAADVARAGIRTVRGRLVVDDTWFDSARLAPFWSWDDEPYYYNAQTSALNVAPNTDDDTGTVLVDIRPARTAGGRPAVTMIPANHYLRIHETATTGAPGSDETVDAVRRHGTNVIDVTGSIPLDAEPAEAQTTVDQPTGLVADLFARALARHGVHVTGHDIGHSATPQAARTVAAHRSIPLDRLLTPFLKLSNNMIAEVLVKAMGRRTAGAGTWSAGTSAILADLGTLGLDTGTIQLFDGSGLGRADYVPTDQLVTLLASARGKPWFTAWYDALPIAGEPDRLVGGTLRNRMGGTAAAGNLHGKTGSMTGVSALSGYVTDARGHHLAFSMISNDFVQGGITGVEDAVAVTLAENGDENARPVAVRPARRGAAAGPEDQLECTWNRTC